MKTIKLGRVLWLTCGRRGYGKLPGWNFGLILLPRERGGTVVAALGHETSFWTGLLHFAGTLVGARVRVSRIA